MATIKMKRGLDKVIQSISLAIGEFGIATDTGNVYVGVTGGNHWVNPPTLGTETAERLKHPRQFSVSGDAAAVGTFDGSADVSLVLHLANLEGLTPGTYTKLTVDSKGRVTGGTTLEVSDLPIVPAAKITGLGSAALLDTGTTAGKVVIVGEDGMLPSQLLPSLAISDTFEAGDEAAMLALNAQKGDICIRTDERKSYILAEGSPSLLSGWKWLKTPDCQVLSVNGRTGAVSLTAGDVGAAPAAHTSAVADFSSLGHVKPGAGMRVEADGALTVTCVDGKQDTSIQFKRGAALPTLSPGEPAMVGRCLYVADAEGTAVKLPTTTELEGHTADMERHITAAERTAWSANGNISVELEGHTADMERHITAAERSAWSASGNISAELEGHTADMERHITAAERSAWNASGNITGEVVEAQALGDIQAGNLVHTFVGNLSCSETIETLSARVLCSACSLDGAWVVLCGYFAEKGKLFSVADGQLTFVCNLPGANGAPSLTHLPYAVAFSPDNTTIAISGPKGGLYFYRIADGTISFQTEIAGVSVYQETTKDIMFSPDGTMVAFCGQYTQQSINTGFAKLYTVTPEGYTLLKTLEDELADPYSLPKTYPPVDTLAFSSDGRYLVTAGSFYGVANIYRIGTEVTYGGKLSLPNTISKIRFRPGTYRLVACGPFVGRAKEYDIAGNEAIEVGTFCADQEGTPLSGTCNAIEFFQDGNLLALGGTFTGKMKLYAVGRGPATYLSDLLPKSGTTINATVRTIATLAGGNTLLVGGDFSGYGLLCHTQLFARQAWAPTVDTLYRLGVAPKDIPNGTLGQVTLFSGPQGTHPLSKDFLPITGGLVTGPLSIATPPTRDAHLTNRAYVDETLKNALSTYVFRTKLEAANWTTDTPPQYVLALDTTNFYQVFLIVPNQMSEAEKLATAKAEIKLHSIMGTTIYLVCNGIKPEIDLNIVVIGTPKINGNEVIISL